MASQNIGVLWKRKTQDGKVFLSGVLRDISGDIQIAVFPNNRKDKDNQPDFNIIRSEQKEERKQQGNDDFDFGAEAPQQEDDEIKVEDIPFGN